MSNIAKHENVKIHHFDAFPVNLHLIAQKSRITVPKSKLREGEHCPEQYCSHRMRVKISKDHSASCSVNTRSITLAKYSDFPFRPNLIGRENGRHRCAAKKGHHFL